MNITEEDIIAWEKQIDKEEALLKEHGWVIEDHKWRDPEGKLHNYNDAYPRLVTRLMCAKGWRTITEIRHVGLKKFPLTMKGTHWARYQSPVTKRIYNYPDAQYIFENNFQEDESMEGYTGSSQLLTKLVPNFEGDSVETWFHRNENNETVLEFWNET